MGIRGLSFLILSLVIISANLPSGEAIKCYACDSISNQNCPSPSNVADCNLYTDCIKCTAKTDSQDVTLRGCINMAMSQVRIKSINCEVCSTDLCNSAITINTNIMTAIGCFALIGAIRFGFYY